MYNISYIRESRWTQPSFKYKGKSTIQKMNYKLTLYRDRTINMYLSYYRGDKHRSIICPP